MPGCLIAMGRLNRPSLMIYGGTIKPGYYENNKIDIISAFQSYGEFISGNIDDQKRKEIIKKSCPGAGACGGMYTANTMASAIEAMGMSLPYSSSTPAVDEKKLNECFEAGKAIKYLLKEDIKPRGHAIECRINAEDPSKNFQPSPGTIGMCHQPSGFRTRVDGAIFQGCKVTPYYDSLISKLICQGRDREEAIQRIQRSLSEFVIEGITTTIDLHKKILSHKKFINSDFDVNWLVKENFY